MGSLFGGGCFDDVRAGKLLQNNELLEVAIKIPKLVPGQKVSSLEYSEYRRGIT